VGLVTLLADITIGALGSVLATEVCLASPWASRIIIRAAARMIANGDYRKRYEAEWLQLLDDLESPTHRLAFAIAIFLKAPIIKISLREGLPSKRSLIRASLAASVALVAPAAIMALVETPKAIPYLVAGFTMSSLAFAAFHRRAVRFRHGMLTISYFRSFRLIAFLIAVGGCGGLFFHFS
jgi:hypothetical protein